MGHLDEVIEGEKQTMLAELLHFYIECRAPDILHIWYISTHHIQLWTFFDIISILENESYSVQFIIRRPMLGPHCEQVLMQRATLSLLQRGADGKRPL